MLNIGTSYGGLRSAILHDFSTSTAEVELQVLGLIGKYLTGPLGKYNFVWEMKYFNKPQGISV